MAIVLALTGYSRCGKNHVASILKERLEAKGYLVGELAYADKLKELVSKFLNIDRNKLDKLKNDETLFPYGEEMLTVRDILKRFSEIIKNDIDPGYFANVVNNKIKYGNNHIYIITDLRFKIEESVLRLLNNDHYIMKIFVGSDLKTCKRFPADEEVDLIEADHLLRNEENKPLDSSILEGIIEDIIH